MIELRPARTEDYDFAFGLYVETIKPYTLAYMPWVDEVETARFARFWTLSDTHIVAFDGQDVGWLEVSDTGPKIFLKQLYIMPAQQRRGIGTEVMRRLITEWQQTGKPIVLGVLKNNPARWLYERLGFSVVGETEMKYIMRRDTSP
jgi:ribosomal protein S18 acetylase RimI-like enzyme